MKLLITGAKGFLGKHLCQKLKKDFEVLAYSDPMSELVKFDKKADVIIHLAHSNRNEENLKEKNMASTQEAISYAKKYGSFFIFASSASVYTFTENKNNKVETEELTPKNDYAISKLESEHLLNQSGLAGYILRIFNPYGPLQSEKFLISYLINEYHQNKAPLIKSPLNIYDFIYIDDVVELIREMIKKSDAETEVKTFNVSSGQGIQIQEISETIKEITKSKINHEVSDNPVSIYAVGDNTKVKEYFSWKQKHSLREGLRKMIQSDEEACNI